MTEEEKELLLKDLCARQYHEYNIKALVKYSFNNETTDWKDVWSEDIMTVTQVNSEWGEIFCNNEWFDPENVKPYLRPMSSMTKEEYNELREMTITSPNLETAAVLFCEHHYDEEPNWRNDWSRCGLSKVLDYLNAHHFDYRGLIEKGLALEAPDGMY